MGSLLRILYGGIVQLAEHMLCKHGVIGSSPITSTITYSSLAQSVEHATVNRRVVGSSPTWGASIF